MRLPSLNWPPNLYVDVLASGEMVVPREAAIEPGGWSEMVDPADKADVRRGFQITAQVVELAKLRS